MMMPSEFDDGSAMVVELFDENVEFVVVVAVVVCLFNVCDEIVVKYCVCERLSKSRLIIIVVVVVVGGIGLCEAICQIKIKSNQIKY